MIRRTFVACVALTMLLGAATAARADSYTGSLTITCTDAFDFGPGIITLSTDNTGTGVENFEIKAVDGNGTVLQDFFNSLTLGDYVFGDLAFTTPPQVNPITVSFISLAGNGFPETVVFAQTGLCQGAAAIPTLSHWGLIALTSLLAMAALFMMIRRRH